MVRCTVAEGTTEKPLPEQRSHVLKTGAPSSLVALRSNTSPLPPHLPRRGFYFLWVHLELLSAPESKVTFADKIFGKIAKNAP